MATDHADRGTDKKCNIYGVPRVLRFEVYLDTYVFPVDAQ